MNPWLMSGIPDRSQTAKKRGKANPSDSTKRKMVSFNDPIPKKSHHNVKHCILCTSDCHKYEKDWTRKKGFGRGQRKSMTHNKSQSSRMSARSLRKAQRRASATTTATTMTLTPPERVGLVAQEGLNVVEINGLVIDR